MQRFVGEESRAALASLQPMFREMERHPVVTAQEERELWRRYRLEHDARAGDELVLANLRFVVMVARQYRGSGVPMSDLIQEGIVGLIKAVRRFRSDMGFRLTSYAGWWIRAQIQGCILSSHSVVRLGTSRVPRKVFFCLASARRELRASAGPMGPAAAEDLEELARRLGVKPEELDEVLHRIEERDVSIESGDLPAARVEAARGWLSDEGPDEGDRLAALRLAVNHLCPRDRRVVEARFMSTPPVKLKVLAAELGVTIARVNQLEVRAVQRLRAALLGRAPPTGGTARPTASLPSAHLPAAPPSEPARRRPAIVPGEQSWRSGASARAEGSPARPRRLHARESEGEARPPGDLGDAVENP